MSNQLRLLFCGAHPDDETLGAGPTLARYAAEGVEVSVLVATLGQKGWFGPEAEYPGPEALGRLREAELRAAIDILGVSELMLLNHVDGELDGVPREELVAEIVAHVRRLRPQVVVTFDPLGNYGHPDHIAISQATAAALVAAADPAFLSAPWAPHRVAKFYYMVDTADTVKGYAEIVGEIAMTINGVRRTMVPWPEWSVGAWVDTTAVREQAVRAAACYVSQIAADTFAAQMAEAHNQHLWSRQGYVRAYSLVDTGPDVEDDLFAGLR